MNTKPMNTVCDHSFEANLFEAGTEVCVYCEESREAPVGLLGDVSASVVVVVLEERRAA